MPQANDTYHMQHALRLAARGLGLTAPNPTVGAVVVKDGRVVGTGVTARGGRPHAEPQALAMAGTDVKGATLYVTLEPCSHHGKTPPCAEAVIKAGIARVVVACRDSNPKVAGAGIAMLRQAGIEVEEDVCEVEARALNEGFFSVMERGRPFVSVKIATSLDGRTATKPGEDRWITGEAARLRGHYLRATHDAILTGIGTVLADDPELTCRLPGREADSPQRVVLDSSLRIAANAKILPAWVFTSESTYNKSKKARAALEKAGSRIFSVPEESGKLSIHHILEGLARRGITKLLVEGGKTLTDAFMASGLADRIYWFRAPQVVGEVASAVDRPGSAPRSIEHIGADILEIYE